MDADGSLLDFDINEVQVSRTIIQSSRRVILVADSQKLGRPAPVRIGHIGDVHVFVTDRLDSPELTAKCEAGENRVRAATEAPEHRTRLFEVPGFVESMPIDEHGRVRTEDHGIGILSRHEFGLERGIVRHQHRLLRKLMKRR